MKPNPPVVDSVLEDDQPKRLVDEVRKQREKYHPAEIHIPLGRAAHTGGGRDVSQD